jgi:2-methylcitrate dehydratase
MGTEYVFLARRENQARGLAQYALDFLAGKFAAPGPAAIAQVEALHLDSVATAIGALATGCRAPLLLRDEALAYPDPAGANCFGSQRLVAPEKAILANSSAARELDANGTNFGYNPRTGWMRGEFGHPDFFPVAVAAAQQAGWDGGQLLRALLLLEEIRCRLAEVYSLKDRKIDHVLHGAIASAVVYGAVLGATAPQIESAIGLVVAHYVPFRAIRHGHQLSDSKGASAAISTEVAVLSMRRAMRGFVGPADIFRNREAVFCLFDPPAEPQTSPFDLELAAGGDDFAVLGEHFKLGLYEHQSAGAIAGLLELLAAHPSLMDHPNELQSVQIALYEPAFSIIGDPHKRDPQTRQSADHSMLYIVATLLRKAHEQSAARKNSFPAETSEPLASVWRRLMLLPADYDDAALHHPLTRALMQRIELRHGGPDYDARYPEGIPTSLVLEHAVLGRLESGLVMFPPGHARGPQALGRELLGHKIAALAALGECDPAELTTRFTNLSAKSAADVRALYSFPIAHVRPA